MPDQRTGLLPRKGSTGDPIRDGLELMADAMATPSSRSECCECGRDVPAVSGGGRCHDCELDDPVCTCGDTASGSRPIYDRACPTHRLLAVLDAPKRRPLTGPFGHPMGRDIGGLHVVMFSGGIGSWATAKRVAEQEGTDHLILLFADTLVEDEDTYRFLHEAAKNVGGEMVIVKDGRTPFQVFKDDRFLGNSRLANCSKFLKQKPCREWLTDNCDPDNTLLYVGIDWTEQHRMPAIVKGWAPYTVYAPLCGRPFLDKKQMIALAKHEGLEPPVAYEQGMPHANCLQQGCVRGGQAYWATFLRTNREGFLESERQEEELRQHLEADVSILKDRAGGDVSVLTLKAFRERLEQQPSLFDSEEWGGCGCFTDDGPDLIQIAEAA